MQELSLYIQFEWYESGVDHPYGPEACNTHTDSGPVYHTIEEFQFLI